MKRILRSARRARQQLKALPEASAKPMVQNEALASGKHFSPARIMMWGL